MFRNLPLWLTGTLSMFVIGGILLAAGTAPGVHAQAPSGPRQSAAPTFPYCTSWPVVPTPNVGSQGSTLLATAAISATDIWAVGYNGSPSGSESTLIEHWNGTAWTAVSSPNTSWPSNVLDSITAIAASNVWAVGYTWDPIKGGGRTLIEHWDGSTWSIVSSPSPGSYADRLLGVAASSATDVWAVGEQGDGSTSGSLIEHWNGTSWQVVPSPTSPPLAQLQAVAVVSSMDAWAVGSYQQGTLTEHWDGTSWQVVSNPDENQGGHLSAVTAISSTNVWAVGANQNSFGASITLIEHWDGTGWSISASPNPGNANNLVNGGDQLDAVVATGPNSVWAAGSYTEVTSNMVLLTLIEQWNGSSWSAVCSNSLGVGNSTLAGLASTGSQVWAVGSFVADSEVWETLAEVYLTSFPIWRLSRHSHHHLPLE